MKHTNQSLSVAQRWIIVVVGIAVGFGAGLIYNSDRIASITFSDEAKKAPRYELNKTLTNEKSDVEALRPMDEEISRYLKRWEIKGASLAISRNDSLVYAKGYGWADEEAQTPMQPGHMLRVASVSKLLTAVGIMKLVETNRLRLSDHVFGADGVLNDTAYTNAVRDKRHFDITVEQLLRHEGGFNNAAGDPMFSTRYIMMQNHLTTPPTNQELIRIVLKRRLGYTPGTMHKYSNFGYMLLSQIIEHVSHMPYEEFMTENVFEPAGCYGFHIAGNYLKDRREGEVHYYMHDGSEPTYEFNNSGNQVVKCYGENDVHSLQGAGGWIASAPELCRLIASIDGAPQLKNILSDESIRTMTTMIPGHQFALGWNVTPTDGPWLRTGTLSGTSANVVRFPDGECWVLITNTSTWRGHGFAKESIAVFDRLRKKYAAAMPHRTLWPMK